MNIVISMPQFTHLNHFSEFFLVSTLNVLKFRTLYSILFFVQNFLSMQLFLKILSEMANCVDPDQTALMKQSDLGLPCLHMPFC